MKPTIAITNYGTYLNENYGTHTLCLNVDNLHLYFSHNSLIIAFESSETGLVVRDWDRAKGKHLSMIRSGCTAVARALSERAV